MQKGKMIFLRQWYQGQKGFLTQTQRTLIIKEKNDVYNYTKIQNTVH